VRSRSASCPSCGAKDPTRKKRRLPGRRIAVPALVAASLFAVVGWTWHAVTKIPTARAESPSKADSAVASAIVPQPQPVKLETRWTANWANVRLHPYQGSAVLEELPPGTRVDAVRDSSGWWFVYAYGDSLGYVAGSLLRASPPDSLQATR